MDDRNIILAAAFAAAKHAGQTRKYTGDLYITHPQAVVAIVRSVQHDAAMLCAAWLHDVIEDTDTELSEIRSRWGSDVANLVDDLTDPSVPMDGNRAARRAIDRAHTALASARAKTIKLADVIHNTSDISKAPPAFAKLYLAEKALLLEVLRGGSAELWERAKLQVC